MNIRPAISAPLPWLTMIAGRVAGKRPLYIRRALRLPRSLSITREGRWFIGILLLIGMAAINTGNNLLYLVVATLLSLIIISGVLSESTLRGLRAARALPEYVYKGAPAAVRYNVNNRKRWLPSFSFRVEEELKEGLKASPSYVLKLQSKSAVTRSGSYVFERRGVYRLTGLKVSTRFPFGIFLKGKVEDSPAEVLVYPDIRLKGSPPSGGGYSRPGETSTGKKGEGTGLYGLRAYTPADDSRFIHWRSAARTGTLLLKEREKESERVFVVVFENYRTEDEAFEALVDRAAGLSAWLVERGFSVGLKTLEGDLPPVSGKAGLHSILRALAVIGPAEGSGTPTVRVVSL